MARVKLKKKMRIAFDLHTEQESWYRSEILGWSEECLIKWQLLLGLALLFVCLQGAEL